MSVPEKSSSRRAVLAAGAVGAVALAAEAITPERAEAANGDALTVGSSSNIASSPTGLEVTGSGVAYGVGVTDNGLGVAPGGNPAILGHTNDQAFQTGVLGYATAAGMVGVEGYALNGATGLHGFSDSGSGATVQSNTGNALYAIGLLAGSVAVTAIGADPASLALDVGGVAQFSRSGIATVAGTTAAPKSSVKVTGVALGKTSLVLATLQQVSGSVAIKAAVPNVAGKSFTIYLTQAVTTSVKIGWFVVN
jgi:hypothetical protein